MSRTSPFPAATSCSAGQLPVHLGQATHQVGRVRQDAEKTAAKHLWKMELGLHVYGQGEGMDAALIRLPDVLADVRDAVTSFVTVEIDRLAGIGLGRQVVSAGLLSYAPYGVDRQEQEDKARPEGADQKECPRRRLR